MNKAQKINLVVTLIVGATGAWAAQAGISPNDWTKDVTDLVMLAIVVGTWLAGHVLHRTPPDGVGAALAPTRPPGVTGRVLQGAPEVSGAALAKGTAGTKGVMALALVVMMGGAVGCETSLNTTAFNSEQLAATTATAATHTFNVYLTQQTNPPPTLLADKTNLYTADIELSKTLALTEALREDYATNSAATNSAALNVAVQTLELQATNIVSLVQSIIAATQ